MKAITLRAIAEAFGKALQQTLVAMLILAALIVTLLGWAMVSDAVEPMEHYQVYPRVEAKPPPEHDPAVILDLWSINHGRHEIRWDGVSPRYPLLL